MRPLLKVGPAAWDWHKTAEKLFCCFYGLGEGVGNAIDVNTRTWEGFVGELFSSSEILYPKNVDAPPIQESWLRHRKTWLL